MSTLDSVALCLAVTAGGVLTGTLNRVGAGGNIFSFLVLTSLGMPPAVANATNLAATPAGFIGLLPQAWRQRRVYGRYWHVFLVAIVGTGAGFGLFLVMPAERFQAIAPLLLGLAAVTLVVYPILKHRLNRRQEADTERPMAMTAGVFVTSTYAGFFGGGVGVMVLLVLAVATAWPWVRANELKNLICLATSVLGLAAYAFTGLVHWPIAILLGASMFVGGLLGDKLLATLSREEAEDFLRETVLLAASFGTGVMIAT